MIDPRYNFDSERSFFDPLPPIRREALINKGFWRDAWPFVAIVAIWAVWAVATARLV